MEHLKHRVADTKGFTLIEVLAAFVIFAVAAVPLVQMLWVGDLVGHQAANKTIALNIAQQKMEEILARGCLDQDETGAFSTGRNGFSGNVTQLPGEGELELVTVQIDYFLEEEECSIKVSCFIPPEA